MKSFVFILFAAICGAQASIVNAAVGLDRTRLVYNEQDKSTSLRIFNGSKALPYLAQAWLENKDYKKEGIPFAVLPPLQRLEADSESLVRIEKTASIADLPQDRESVFYFNLREIPPKSDKENVMQIAMQTQIKMFYRPKNIGLLGGGGWQEKLILNKVATGFKVINPTAYHITVTKFALAEKENSIAEFAGFMIEPKSSLDLPMKDNKFNHFVLTYINDYGGHIELLFTCGEDKCAVKK
ncbi:molecular chaperone [Iodobacter sp. CM08]|uniref:fimbrial biogenesis chaperone n=1 Tax=Iodobacter sp. CM08 TaxID=3085902 RepID=UPI002980C106|nr:molecular chaperone [Iodobacter sp. CM08]MDW5415855.1 molecular chaperone [Iodobacter sp. CM08]